MSSTSSYKVIFLGDSGVGKTSIILRLFNEWNNVPPTICSQSCQFTYGGLNYLIYDTAGQERFRSLVPMYIRGSSIIILVFDVTDIDSLNSLSTYYEQAKNMEDDAGIILIGNKTDLPQTISQTDIENMEKKMNTKCIYTSALHGFSVSDIFDPISNLITKFEKHKVDIPNSTPLTPQNPDSKKCC